MNALIATSSLSLAGIAAVLDSHSRRIPNWLSYGGLLLALGFHGFGEGSDGLRLALSGAAVGGGILLPLWLLRGVAAGDVKLMAAVGAFLGPAAAGFCAVATLIAGGLLAAVWVMHARVVGRAGGTQPSMPYAPAIALGTVSTFLLAWFTAT